MIRSPHDSARKPKRGLSLGHCFLIALVIFVLVAGLIYLIQLACQPSAELPKKEVPPMAPVEAWAEPVQKSAKQIFREADYLVHLDVIYREKKDPDRIQYSYLSGMLINFQNRQLILTAGHITKDSIIIDLIHAELKGERNKFYEVSLDKVSQALDCATLTINEKDFQYFGKFASLDILNKSEIGDVVYALGSPMETRFSVSKGVISNLSYGRGANTKARWERLLVHDAIVFPGSSGGPLVNDSGMVVGMNIGIHPDFNSFGTAVPMDDILHWLILNYN